MPLYKTLTNRHNTKVYIWRIEESEAWLRSGLDLTKNSLERLVTMSSELHRRGFLSIRHLLREAGYTDQDLYYSDEGKPFLKDKRHISITHSFEFTGIVISDERVGIDIEKQRDKIMRIASKFISYEHTFVESFDKPVKELSVIWCAKESMYKLYGTRGLGFKAHCYVEPFNMELSHTTSRLIYQDDELQFDVYYMELENFMLAYILPALNA